MPYIKQSRRDAIKYADYLAENPGDLNYIITLKIKDYLENQGLSYQTINDIIGVLECCKLEFIRRVVNNYEEKKRIENGDVYSCIT